MKRRMKPVRGSARRPLVGALLLGMSLFFPPLLRGQEGEEPGLKPPSEAEKETPRLGLRRRTEGAFEGYTLLAPIRSLTTYLIDMEGRVVHTWKSDRTPGHAAYLLENGHLLRAERDPENEVFHSGGEGGIVCEYTWEGKRVWEYRYAGPLHLQHHDIEPLPNGNVLFIAWERKRADEAVRAGRDPKTLPAGELWSEAIMEVKPKPPRDGEIVWEWHVWDHLLQDRDPKKPGYGKAAEHLERIDINAGGKLREPPPALQARLEQLGYAAPARRRGRGRGGPGADWLHINSVAYNPALDQVALSVHNLNEIWIIDHGTSTAEAAGHKRGRGGKGGDLLYRWGNPAAYGLGDEGAQVFFGQHDARWVKGVDKDGWGILVFNNGAGAGGGAAGRGYSTVDLLALPVDEKGRYSRDSGRPFGPRALAWSVGEPEGARGGLHFFSHAISGAQHLPNGNVLICSGEAGRLVEVTPEKKVVWEYVCPFGRGELPAGKKGGPRRPGGAVGRSRGGMPEGPPRFGPPRGPGPGFPGRGGGGGGSLFRALRLAPDHPGLAGRKLKPVEETRGGEDRPPGQNGRSS